MSDVTVIGTNKRDAAFFKEWVNKHESPRVCGDLRAAAGPVQQVSLPEWDQVPSSLWEARLCVQKQQRSHRCDSTGQEGQSLVSSWTEILATKGA